MKNLHGIRKVISTLARLAPRSWSANILKQYLYDSDLALSHGMLCIRQEYSSPVTVASEIDVGLLGQKRILPGININAGEISLLAGKLAAYTCDFPWRSKSGTHPEVTWGEMFPTLDSLVLHAMIRHFKPQKYIEVGCGYSSRVSTDASRKNTAEGSPCSVIYVEPYPGERMVGADLEGEIIVKKIQQVPLERFQSLEAGDMLFIDTSHIMKCQSDVEWELLHILPSLKKGVIVHVHDIYTPYEQPPAWLDNNYAPGMYNEQYALEALLSGGGKFSSIFPIHWLCREMPGQLQDWFGVPADSSRSFWIEVN